MLSIEIIGNMRCLKVFFCDCGKLNSSVEIFFLPDNLVRNDRNMPKNTKIGDRIADAAEVKGISVSEITAGIGASKGYVKKLINNEISVPHKYLHSLSSLLGVSENWLLTGSLDVMSGENASQNIRCRVIGSVQHSECLIPYPVVFPEPVVGWYFAKCKGAFAEKTLVILERDYTSGSGLFLGYHKSRKEHTVVPRIDTLNGHELANWDEHTDLIGRILLYSRWDGQVKFDVEETEKSSNWRE